MMSLLTLLLFSWGFAAGQATGPVEVLVPGLISVRAPADALSLDLSAHGYPPLEFPVRCPGGTMPIQLFANTDGAWQVSLEICDIVCELGLLLVSDSQVY